MKTHITQTDHVEHRGRKRKRKGSAPRVGRGQGWESQGFQEETKTLRLAETREPQPLPLGQKQRS